MGKQHGLATAAERAWWGGDDDSARSCLQQLRSAGVPVEWAVAEWGFSNALHHRSGPAQWLQWLGAYRLTPAQSAIVWLLQAESARLWPELKLRAWGEEEAAGKDILEPALQSRVEVMLAWRELAQGQWELGRERLDTAARLALGEPSVSLGQLHQARGRWVLRRGAIAGAESHFKQAIGQFAGCLARRAEGRALLEFGLEVAPRLTGGEPPAVWLGRAQAALGQGASHRDRAELRAGFRRYGRRLFDTSLAESVARRIDQFELACADLSADSRLSEQHLLVAAEEYELPEAQRQAMLGQVASWPSSIRQPMDRIRRVGGELAELIGSALADRERMRQLLRGLASIPASTEPEAFGKRAAELAGALVDADRVVIALVPEGQEPELLGQWCREGSQMDESWRASVQAAFRKPSAPPTSGGPVSLRAEARPKGPLLVVPLETTGFRGAVYGDKLSRLGQFRDSDHHLLTVFGEYVAQGIARTLAERVGRLASDQLGATLAAIRDGVISLGPEGKLQSANAAALRMLRLPKSAVGRRLLAYEALQPLSALLEANSRCDGSLVRLPHGSVVVTARPLSGDGSSEGAAGVVATLVELDRARRIAQNISAARPRYQFRDIIGASAAMTEALRLGQQAADVDAGVLITGESGTGKEVLAQAIHTGGLAPTRASSG